MATPVPLSPNLTAAIADIVDALSGMDPYVGNAWVVELLATLPASPGPVRQGHHNPNLMYSQHVTDERGTCVAWFQRAADCARAVRLINTYSAVDQAESPMAVVAATFDQFAAALGAIEPEHRPELAERFTALLWHACDAA